MAETKPEPATERSHALNELFSHIDLKKLIRDTFLDGYATYEDYVKYGDAFIPVGRPVYTPSSASSPMEGTFVQVLDDGLIDQAPRFLSDLVPLL